MKINKILNQTDLHSRPWSHGNSVKIKNKRRNTVKSASLTLKNALMKFLNAWLFVAMWVELVYNSCKKGKTTNETLITSFKDNCWIFMNWMISMHAGVPGQSIKRMLEYLRQCNNSALNWLATPLINPQYRTSGKARKIRLQNQHQLILNATNVLWRRRSSKTAVTMSLI